MGESGCVAYMFDEKGILTIDRETYELDEDELMMKALEAGADDVVVNDDCYEILTQPREFETIKTALEKEGLHFSEAAIRWTPQNTVAVEGENAETLLKMMDAFEDNDDVQDVYANFELSES